MTQGRPSFCFQPGRHSRAGPRRSTSLPKSKPSPQRCLLRRGLSGGGGGLAGRTQLSLRLLSWACRNRSCMTTTGAWCRSSCRTVHGNGPGPSAGCNPITSSKTVMAVPARAPSEPMKAPLVRAQWRTARWRGWLATPGGTSRCRFSSSRRKLHDGTGARIKRRRYPAAHLAVDHMARQCVVHAIVGMPNCYSLRSATERGSGSRPAGH